MDTNEGIYLISGLHILQNIFMKPALYGLNPVFGKEGVMITGTVGTDGVGVSATMTIGKTFATLVKPSALAFTVTLLVVVKYT